MVQYDKAVLHKLLDSYERSKLFTGDNQININISFPVNKKTLPAYFEESSAVYEDIHALLQECERKGYVRLVWKRRKVGHILEKVILCPEKLKEIYVYVKRTPQTDILSANLKALSEWKDRYDTPICLRFMEFLEERLRNSQSVKEFIDTEKLSETEALLKGIYAVEQNTEQCYVREFSIKNFHDTKFFEKNISKIVKVMRRFCDEFTEKDGDDILAEYGIYHTPNYVYFKGNVTLYISGEALQIGTLKQGIGISGDDISKIQFKDVEDVENVLTIENLTTFFRWNQEKTLMIYLGGYHNSLRCTLLKMIYEKLPKAQYLHFGDIDAGGFEIYRDLCERTQIPFMRFCMDRATLEKYADFGRKLSENDKVRLQKMMEQRREDGELTEVIQYMLNHDLKLEQECMFGFAFKCCKKQS
ncbi:MAG: hypothetical protein IKK03_07455 [Lachnospiraceae bacterium]|nr:hypothetical protein [Lachnospiraceae bacterium]